MHAADMNLLCKVLSQAAATPEALALAKGRLEETPWLAPWWRWRLLEGRLYASSCAGPSADMVAALVQECSQLVTSDAAGQAAVQAACAELGTAPIATIQTVRM